MTQISAPESATLSPSDEQGYNPVTGNSTIHFSVFELDLEAGELRRNGSKIRLQQQPLQILVSLLERPGKVVSREELRRKLWPADTFVDFDHGLNAAIRRLREALDDSAEAPRFVETVARRGYRFIAPVDSPPAPVQEPALPASVAYTPVPTHENRSHAKALVGLVAVLTSLAVLLFAFNVGHSRDRLLGRTAPRIESIAVLPFENLSGDPAQEYFADGMTEELVTNLGKISTLRVISRTSVMRYKGSKKLLPEIARELNVDAIVEGTVQRSGNHVRVTANLLYASTDRHLWAESYESELGDVLILQGKVARSIAGEIGIKLMSQEKTRLASARSVNPDAYEAYLKAKYYASKWSEEGFKKSVASFRQAIDIDPAYAPAYGGLGEVYCLMGLWGLKPSTEIYPLAKAAALKALELDDGLAEAHADLGLVKFQFDWDWSGGERELKRAVTLNPSSSSARLFYGIFLTVMGRADESVKETQIALELDPLTPSTNVQLGWVLYYARRHDESIAQLKKALELDPDFGYANMELGWNYAQMGMNQKAATECQRAVGLASGDQVTLAGCGDVFGTAGRHKDALALLDRLRRLSTQEYVDPYNFAWLYDGLGDNKPTMEWLERAYRARSASLPALRVEIWSDRLRSDRRFQQLVQRMNFPK